jgi:hypothetical protein
MKLAFENMHLVPEHHDLDVLVRLCASGRHAEAEDPTQGDVEERESHAGSSPCPYEKCQSRGPIGVSAPFSTSSVRNSMPFDRGSGAEDRGLTAQAKNAPAIRVSAAKAEDIVMNPDLSFDR